MSDIIIYPAYLDKQKTRSEGRRVSRDEAIENPKPKEIANAVEQIGYTSILEDKRYPRTWWEKGRVTVKDSEEPKTEILRAICIYIDAMRQ